MITEYKKIKQPNGSMGFQETVVLENVPCRLSYKTIAAASQDNDAASVSQSITLFVSPDVLIAPGSKVTVTQNNVTTDYQRSGAAAVYSTHQEISLEIFKGWA